MSSNSTRIRRFRWLFALLLAASAGLYLLVLIGTIIILRESWIEARTFAAEIGITTLDYLRKSLPILIVLPSFALLMIGLLTCMFGELTYPHDRWATAALLHSIALIAVVCALMILLM